MGHIAINFPHSKDQVKKGKYKRHHAHAAYDDEPDHKRVKENDSSEGYVLISSLTGKITHGNDTWIIDSGASKHMIGYKDSPHKVKLEDDYQYPIKGVGQASYRLDSIKPLKMNDVLYVPGLKKNILSI
jgi:hypothetical protein